MVKGSRSEDWTDTCKDDMGRSDSKNANLKNDFLGEKELTPSAKPN